MPAVAIHQSAVGVGSSSRALQMKRATLAVTVANDTGAFTGYASLFGVLDSGGDVVMAGAFARSLRKRSAAGVKMLWESKRANQI